MNKWAGRLAVTSFLFLSTFSFADIPELPQRLQCLNSQRQAMNYNNKEVMSWRTSTQNSYLNRGFVQGKITDIYADQTNAQGKSHSHFSLDLDGRPGGEIELIFNDEFGPLPKLVVGAQVIACGDYITANSQSRLPSPMGAIIHWLHYNPGTRDGGVHSNGFVIIGGKVYGFTKPPGQ